MNPRFSKIVRTGLAALSFAALHAQAQAIFLVPSGVVAIAGTTVAARPELGGVVIADQIVPINYVDGAGRRLFGTLQRRVVRETAGNLTFYYRLKNSPNSNTDMRLAYCRSFKHIPTATVFLTDVDFRLDGLGAIGPLRASRSADARIVLFNFNAIPIAPGQESRFFFSRTNARRFNRGGVITIRGLSSVGGAVTVNLPVFQPIP